jgi:putative Mg2+ transporter-C (MgtC) family protein
MLGAERESGGKAAGLRTHMLVSGAALFVIAPRAAGLGGAALARMSEGGRG